MAAAVCRPYQADGPKRCGAQPQSERARAKSAQPKNTQAESVPEPASAAAEN